MLSETLGQAERKCRLGLGSVQFGMAYGVSNRTGQVEHGEVAAILNLSQQRGVDLIDTAPAYGDSESTLGALLPTSAPFAYVTKTLPLTTAATGDPVDAVIARFHESLARLRRPAVHGLLVHDPAGLRGPHGHRLIDALKMLRRNGLVARIGASLYDDKIVGFLRERDALDIVQLPVNLFDQRFVQSGCLAALQARGVEIHVRSALLQGLLLMEPYDLPVDLRGLCGRLMQARQIAAQCGLSMLELALAYVRDTIAPDYLIVGVTSCREAEQLFDTFERTGAPLPDLSGLAVDNEALVRPDMWAAA